MIVPAQGFQGLHVLTLESRRAMEISRLIETYQGKPLSAPAVREIPLTENEPSLRFARELIAGGVDMVIFLTGVGAKALRKVLEDAELIDPFLTALRRVKVVARGPKPLVVLREWNIPVRFTAPEPCTWREVLRGLDDLPGGVHAQRIVVQEYGASNPEFLSALRERGATVDPVAVYQWALPLDTEPLRNAINALLERRVDVALFTTGVQVAHLFEIAKASGQEEKLREALSRVVVASIGPSTSETLRSFGISVDLEPSHPKMGVLVKEAAESATSLLSIKRPD
jgi:uroporphyrinogen-III synthase